MSRYYKNDTQQNQNIENMLWLHKKGYGFLLFARKL